MMVEPVCKPGLEIPGGIRTTMSRHCRPVREVREELGIEPAIGASWWSTGFHAMAYGRTG
jgi:hypothetical protein